MVHVPSSGRMEEDELGKETMCESELCMEGAATAVAGLHTDAVPATELLTDVEDRWIEVAEGVEKGMMIREVAARLEEEIWE